MGTKGQGHDEAAWFEQLRQHSERRMKAAQERNELAAERVAELRSQQAARDDEHGGPTDDAVAVSRRHAREALARSADAHARSAETHEDAAELQDRLERADPGHGHARRAAEQRALAEAAREAAARDAEASGGD